MEKSPPTNVSSAPGSTIRIQGNKWSIPDFIRNPINYICLDSRQRRQSLDELVFKYHRLLRPQLFYRPSQTAAHRDTPEIFRTPKWLHRLLGINTHFATLQIDQPLNRLHRRNPI